LRHSAARPARIATFCNGWAKAIGCQARPQIGLMRNMIEHQMQARDFAMDKPAQACL
jgi:hypothetical protein